jgi:hypothetical protein
MRDAHPDEGNHMIRRLFNAASLLSLLLCLFSVYAAVGDAYIGQLGGAIYWDDAAGRWLPVTRGQLNREAAMWSAAAVAFGVAPGLWLKYFLKKRHEGRTGTGTCIICGYDLRASNSRCPECGTPIPLRSSLS